MQLIKEVKTYRCETEAESDTLIQAAKDGQAEGGYEVMKTSAMLKTKKSKGEIVDSWVQTEITFNHVIED
jgi:hypothetical protein